MLLRAIAAQATPCGCRAWVLAIGMIASFAFDQLGLRRLTASSYTCNHGINFTLRRFGFAVEGRMREAFILSEGRYVDAFRWGLLSAEWKPGGRG